MMLNNWLKWTATASTLLGAAATSLALDPLNIWLLNIGSILFLWWSIRIKDSALIAVNAGLLMIYGVGFVLRLWQ